VKPSYHKRWFFARGFAFSLKSLICCGKWRGF
jgi:hypothetical protein